MLTDEMFQGSNRAGWERGESEIVAEVLVVQGQGSSPHSPALFIFFSLCRVRPWRFCKQSVRGRKRVLLISSPAGLPPEYYLAWRAWEGKRDVGACTCQAVSMGAWNVRC